MRMWSSLGSEGLGSSSRSASTPLRGARKGWARRGRRVPGRSRPLLGGAPRARLASSGPHHLPSGLHGSPSATHATARILAASPRRETRARWSACSGAAAPRLRPVRGRGAQAQWSAAMGVRSVAFWAPNCGLSSELSFYTANGSLLKHMQFVYAVQHICCKNLDNVIWPQIARFARMEPRSTLAACLVVLVALCASPADARRYKRPPIGPWRPPRSWPLGAARGAPPPAHALHDPLKKCEERWRDARCAAGRDGRGGAGALPFERGWGRSPPQARATT
jgi:hypothetical protein